MPVAEKDNEKDQVWLSNLIQERIRSLERNPMFPSQHTGFLTGNDTGERGENRREKWNEGPLLLHFFLHLLASISSQTEVFAFHGWVCHVLFLS